MKHKKLTVGEIFTDEMLNKARPFRTGKEIHKHVVQDILPEVNQRTKQSNDPLYISYLLEHIFNLEEEMESKNLVKKYVKRFEDDGVNYE